jgi:beta-1,4-mannooligosaccharide/beta-1,4-mannosyl-N-acetylglucosamine phosphorylase
MHNELYPFRRYENNPILTRDDVPYPCNTVFNAAACRYMDSYILLLRIEDLRGHSHLTIARSKDGYNFRINLRPWIRPSHDPHYRIYEQWGVEDPRITPIDGTYYICYTAYGPYGVRVGLGYTEDFKTFHRITLATEVDNKDAVLFPEKIKGNYVMINRPGGMGGKPGTIWISYSPDLIHWGNSRLLLKPEPGWGSQKLGISTPPIKTEKGWLTLYHGVRTTGGGSLYRVGAVLLDLDDPSKILGYTPHFIFGPNADYERTGDVPNVVFPCGIIQEDSDNIKMYYGAADTCIALAEAHLSEVISLCFNPKKC